MIFAVLVVDCKIRDVCSTSAVALKFPLSEAILSGEILHSKIAVRHGKYTTFDILTPILKMRVQEESQTAPG